MIRFRNPSSSLETMLASFDQLYDALKNKDSFNNNDIASVLASANLMASSGFTGKDAIALGANANRSLDKTYNNAKMFAETFRLLGLISIVNQTSSNYRFTYIGEHMAAPGANKKALVEQCLLGINNPNRIMKVSYDENVRFFACVLLTMSQLDGCICRDEMIIGPMCVNDNSEEFDKMVQYINDIRGDYSRLQHKLEDLARALSNNKKEGMKVTSVQNCTRFPISAMKYCGWVEGYKEKKIYGRSVEFMKLTKHGCETIEKLKRLKDIRLSDYDKLSHQQQQALIRLGIYQMLGRANFDLSPVMEELKIDHRECFNILGCKRTLFSPYQILELDTVNDALEVQNNPQNGAGSSSRSTHPINIARNNALVAPMTQQVTINRASNFDNRFVTDDVKEFVSRVQKLKGLKNIDEIVAEIVAEHAADKKTEFYPFVETLFRIIGVDCHKSRDGVNGERWDAMIRDTERSIPIEIKSPTEELHISVKAIRQALENKIILLSRETYQTTPECSTYAIGYQFPNERAEVADLIRDIKKTFGYKIAVFDITSLVKVAVNIILYEKGIEVQKLYELEGLVNVTNIES